MDEQVLKILAIFCLLLIALIFGLAPLYCVWRYQGEHQNSRFQICFSFMNAFVGGVFMSIALLHLLPDVRELLGNAFAAINKPYSYSWAELIASMGFFFIAFLEFGVEFCFGKIGEHGDYESVAFASNSSQSYTDPNDITLSTPQGNDKDESASPNVLNDQLDSNKYNDIIQACVLLISLSVHSIFEGLSLGLQSDNKGVLELFIAISVHKGMEALGVALSVARSQARVVTKVLSMIFFSMMSPIGIIIGMRITSSESSSRDMITGVLEGLATGTFLYITFLEILPHELKSKSHRLPKLIAVLLGFTVIAAILSI